MQRDVAAFKDCSDFHSEGLAASIALIGADPRALALHLTNAIAAAALGANGAIWPNARLYEFVGGFFIVEVFGAENGHGYLLVRYI
jgi:hypothetical protein